MSRVSAFKTDAAEVRQKGTVVNERKSYTSWLKDALESDPVVARINKRFSALVGLELEPAEPLQVLRYQVGGSYYPHFDWGYVQYCFVKLLNFKKFS